MGRRQVQSGRSKAAASAVVLLALSVAGELSLGGLIGSGSRPGGTVAAASGLRPVASDALSPAAGAAREPGALGGTARVPAGAGGAVVPAAAATQAVTSSVPAAHAPTAPAPAVGSGARLTAVGARSMPPTAISGGAASAASASRNVTPPAVATPPAPAVTCQTDLPLAQSPDAPYNFLCRSGFTPLTWASSDVTMYVGPLTGLQSQAFSLALPEWEAAAGFSVTAVADRSSAQIVVTDDALGSEASGFTTNGYSTDSYSCAPTCYYEHAQLVLSSSSVLTVAGWESTILHELGHVAGLNHVSRIGEVMYPYLAAVPPVTYSPSDLAGLAVLAAGRGR